MTVYRWSENARLGGDPQEVGEWIESLERKTPDIIVQNAKKKDSPGHRYFTWKDNEAAHKWRIQEARTLVNAIVVEEKNEEENYTRPAFESVIIQDERMYVSTSIESLSDDDIWEQISGEAIQTIKSLQKKLKTYSHLRKFSVDQAQIHLDMAREAITK